MLKVRLGALYPAMCHGGLRPRWHSSKAVLGETWAQCASGEGSVARTLPGPSVALFLLAGCGFSRKTQKCKDFEIWEYLFGRLSSYLFVWPIHSESEAWRLRCQLRCLLCLVEVLMGPGKLHFGLHNVVYTSFKHQRKIGGWCEGCRYDPFFLPTTSLEGWPQGCTGIAPRAFTPRNSAACISDKHVGMQKQP